jgi:hypothetical protein
MNMKFLKYLWSLSENLTTSKKNLACLNSMVQYALCFVQVCDKCKDTKCTNSEHISNIHHLWNTKENMWYTKTTNKNIQSWGQNVL